MMVYYQTLLEATAADPKDAKTAFEILSSHERGDLDGWVGALPKSDPHGQISRSSRIRIRIVDPNIGSVDLDDTEEE
jgi:hypothetical protein